MNKIKVSSTSYDVALKSMCECGIHHSFSMEIKGHTHKHETEIATTMKMPVN